MITETKFYYHSSINADFDMQKVKLSVSNYKDIDEKVNAIVGFDILHVKNVYNDKLFIEEINQEVNLVIDYCIISSGFVQTSYTLNVNMKELYSDWDTINDKFDSFLIRKRKFKNSEFQSFDEFARKSFNGTVINLDKILPRMSKEMDEDFSMVEKNKKFKEIVEDNSCIKMIGKSSFIISASSINTAYYKINNIEDIPEKDYNLIIDCKFTGIKVYKDKNDIIYYNGDSDLIDQIRCEKYLVNKKIREIISFCEAFITECKNIADKILDRINSSNPIYWKNISIDVECLQLAYIQAQHWITNVKVNIEKENIFKDQYTKDYYQEFHNEYKHQLSIINSLESKVDAALLNISTPIKSRNDFKLQESTERGNDRILFLSFIAMSIPLISYIVSDTLSQMTKIISGIVIGTLPLLYFLINKWYKKRLTHSYDKNNLEIQLNGIKDSVKMLKKQIQTIKQNDVSGGVDFIHLLEQGLKVAIDKEKRIKEKLKKYKRYKFE